jgi:hypothetical protein
MRWVLGARGGRAAYYNNRRFALTNYSRRLLRHSNHLRRRTARAANTGAGFFEAGFDHVV